jgi:signal transduction histidine kinase
LKDDGAIREWVGTCVDITERKRAEEALKRQTKELQRLAETLEQRVRERTEELEKANEGLRQLSSKLLSAQEEERKRIAGEIHDTLGSCLTSIKFKIEDTLQRIEGTPNVAAESLNTLIPMIHEGVEECRRIQMDLRPSMLDDLGLLPALSWLFRKFQAIYSQIQIAQEIEIEDKDIPPSLKTVIFRVTQEAMNNIAKYSKGNLARLSLRRLDNRMELAIEDNGQGFSLGMVTGSEMERRGLGLTSMRERVELSGGSFYIESFEGKGTTIRASWPLDECGSIKVFESG